MAITASEARSDLFGLIERVNLDQTEVEITSKRGSAVLMSKDEYDSLLETTYLLRSPKNARRLIGAIESARAGNVTEHDLSGERPQARLDSRRLGRLPLLAGPGSSNTHTDQPPDRRHLA